MHPTRIKFLFKRCAIEFSITVFLQLCIIKSNNADTDVALGKMTSSSTLMTWFGDGGVTRISNSSAAVNGVNNQLAVTNGSNSGAAYFPRACTVASSDELGWWTVDLGDTYHITSIQVWGVPTPDCADMNGYFSIQVMTSTNDSQPQTFTGCKTQLDASMNYNYTTNIPSDVNLIGSIVKIFKINSSPTKVLALCTVNVFSDTPVPSSTSTSSTTTCATTTTSISTTTTKPTTTSKTTTSTSTTTPTTTSTTKLATTTSSTTTTTASMMSTDVIINSSISIMSTTASLSPVRPTEHETTDETPASSLSEKGSELSGGAIAGIVVGVTVGVLIVAGVILLVCWRRHRYGNKKMPPMGSLTVYTDINEIEKDSNKQPEDVDGGTPLDKVTLPEVTVTDIPVSSLPAYVRTELTKHEYFTDEFKRIPARQNMLPVTEANKEHTIAKSRYKNIVPYDFNRVKLTMSSNNDNSDFINASFISGFNGKDKYYIATQGPKKQTLIDFWRMIYEYKCTRIVMVTRVIESGKKKCEQYYAEGKGNSVLHGQFSIETTDVEHYADFVIRTLQVTKAGARGCLTVYHFHYEQWLDKNVPDLTFSLLHFRRKVHAYDSVSHGTPLVVHCSAGVGRTGTFIALDLLLDQIKVKSKVNVAKCVMELRQQRMCMIQSVDQYRFLHKALAEAVETGDVVIPATSLIDTLPTLKHSSSGDDGSKSVIEQQFMVMNSLKPEAALNDMGTYANVPHNEDHLPSSNIADLSHVELIVPYPELVPDPNAFYLPGYRRRDAYIVTCHPYLANATVSFWSMVAAHRCHVVVSLTELVSHNDQQKPYLPADEHSETYGPVKVTVEGVILAETRPGLVIHQLHITAADKKYSSHVQPLTLYHVQVMGWSKDSPLPAHLNTIVDLLLTVHNWRSGSTEATPTVIHCSDGSLQSGYVYAAAYISEQIMVDGDVDVFTAVRHAQTVLPRAVSSLTQYESLHELAAAYLSRDQTRGGEYTNIVPNQSIV